MRSLFFKIFLSFIFITLFASVSTALISNWIQIGPFGKLKERILHHQFRALTQTLSKTSIASEELLKKNAKAELRHYLHEVAMPRENHVFLVKDDDSSIFKTELPPKIKSLAALARQSGKIQRSETNKNIMVALPLVNKGEQKLVLVGISARVDQMFIRPQNTSQRPGLFRLIFHRPLGLLVLLLVCIAAIGCYLLARSLTSPIRHLRKATQQMTDGDFSVRVEEQEAPRRGNEIAELSHDFNTMARQTQVLLTSQKRLLRDISHELRSPLTRQNIALELTRQQFPDAEPYLARIEKESNRLNELIDLLLVLTKLENNVDSIATEIMPLERLLEDIVCDAHFEAVNLNRTIKCHLENVIVKGSPEILRRGFENIIRNGLHYTAEKTAVEINVTKVADTVRVSVRDHGPGVPEDDLEQIFRPFFRVAKSRDRDSGGTGVGLAIAKQAILLHGGTIKAQNAINGGLIIEVNLPIAE